MQAMVKQIWKTDSPAHHVFQQQSEHSQLQQELFPSPREVSTLRKNSSYIWVLNSITLTYY